MLYQVCSLQICKLHPRRQRREVFPQQQLLTREKIAGSFWVIMNLLGYSYNYCTASMLHY